jgi:hypothetical protein
MSAERRGKHLSPLYLSLAIELHFSLAILLRDVTSCKILSEAILVTARHLSAGDRIVCRSIRRHCLALPAWSCVLLHSP